MLIELTSPLMNDNLAPDFIDRIMSAFGRMNSAFTSDHWLFVILALVPVLAWIYLFLQHQPENKVRVAITFGAGMFAVIPIFVFQHEIGRIGDWLTSIGGGAVLTIVFAALWVGLYEETAKHWIVKKVDKGFFRSIDDAIQFSIIGALGFAFLENVLYFYSIWNNPLIENFWFYYGFRSIGSMFLHIFASGIFGYYYGVAHFAQPVLQEKIRTGKRFPLIGWLHRVLHLRSETLFHEEKILEGLVLAAVLHGTFDFLMGMSQHATDEGSALAQIWLALAVPFLVGGFFWLTYLLDKKEDHKQYGHVTDERTSNVKIGS